MSQEMKWIRWQNKFPNSPVPEGAYVSEEKLDTGRGSIPKYMIVKREDALWATMGFDTHGMLYVPFVSNFQTKEVRPNTGLYRTLTDAKDGFKLSKRFR